MNYLFVPKNVLAEKPSNLKNAVDEFGRMAQQFENTPFVKEFQDLLFLHYRDFKELQNYTLAPPGVRVSEVKKT